jgi:DNA-binding XRE family transcriptional regulator
MSKPGGTIYAIGAVGTSYVKIGSTRTSVVERLKMLQTGQPFPLQILANVPVEEDLHRIEKQVHAFLEQERLQGEWFDIPMDMATLEALIVRAVAYLAAQATPQDRGERTQPIDPTLGERIRLMRRKHGLTQQELATRAQMSKTALNQIEMGKADPRVSRLRAIADILGVSMDYLAGRQEEDGTPPAPRPRRRTATPVG